MKKYFCKKFNCKKQFTPIKKEKYCQNCILEFKNRDAERELKWQKWEQEKNLKEQENINFYNNNKFRKSICNSRFCNKEFMAKRNKNASLKLIKANLGFDDYCSTSCLFQESTEDRAERLLERKKYAI
jgi:hypothetical protein